MRRVFCWMLLGVGLSLRARCAEAADLPTRADADSKQVNEWMEQRAITMLGARKLESEVREAWSDTAYTSPEIDKLRNRYRDLQQELLRTQREIQKQVQELPAVQAKMRQLEEAKGKEQELSRKIAEKTGE